MGNKEQIINSTNIMYARSLEFMDEDLRNNKTDNFNLTCTFRGYMVGTLQKDNYGVLRFLDIINDETFGYLYFNKVSEAERVLLKQSVTELFVMNANPIRDIGITGEFTKEELVQRLRKVGLYFNFMDDGLGKDPKLIKK